MGAASAAPTSPSPSKKLTPNLTYTTYVGGKIGSFVVHLEKMLQFAPQKTGIVEGQQPVNVRILSYNILLGATRRLEPLSNLIASTQADIIGLVEATNPYIVEELAKRLHMDFRITGRGTRPREWHLAVLSRYPILHTHIHTHPETLVRKHMLEVCIEVPNIGPLTVFVVHLTADFLHGNKGNRLRRRETETVLSIMHAKQGTPHLLMGDFNTIAPGDKLLASHMLAHLVKENQRYYDRLHLGYPSYLRKRGIHATLRRLSMRIIATIMLSSTLSKKVLDIISPSFAKGGIDLLKQAGYVDSFRHIHPRSLGFTCPAAVPSGRIDYIFASPEMAPLLANCDIVLSGNGTYAEQASDHIPVMADFTL